ncbi:hypothetical protein BDV09DRAFT_166253, partial [Aspergillus tetrazonus]
MQPLALPTTPLFKVTNGFALQPVETSCTTSSSTKEHVSRPGSHLRISERTGLCQLTRVGSFFLLFFSQS